MYETLINSGWNGDFKLIKDIALDKKEVEAYIEIHTEQGKRLMKSNKPIAIVEHIVGQTRLMVNNNYYLMY